MINILKGDSVLKFQTFSVNFVPLKWLIFPCTYISFSLRCFRQNEQIIVRSIVWKSIHFFERNNERRRKWQWLSLSCFRPFSLIITSLTRSKYWITQQKWCLAFCLCCYEQLQDNFRIIRKWLNRKIIYFCCNTFEFKTGFLFWC